MDVVDLPDFQVHLHKMGRSRYSPVTYPVRYGRYSEIRTRDYVFQYDLNGEVRHVQARRAAWPGCGEWLKRTVAGDWVYYATSGGYSRALALIGEHYLPCFSYPTNTIFPNRPFRPGCLARVLAALDQTRDRAAALAPSASTPAARAFLEQVAHRDDPDLASRAQQFRAAVGGPVPVLPPDTRHVDYNVLPVILADGCLHHCSFCRVASGHPFRVRATDQVARQISGLAEFLGPDLVNYNAVFLGQHDALEAGEAAIDSAARAAWEGFHLDRSVLSARFLFLFGSVTSLLGAGESTFAALDDLPFYTYINIGLESFDQETLATLGKPLPAGEVSAAFARMQEVNRRWHNVEVSANLLLGGDLPPAHLDAILEHTGRRLDRYYSKGAIYLSPMDGPDAAAQIREQFRSIKRASRLPAYLYLIQRL